MPEKRRLPVLSNTAGGGEEEERPLWQWIGFGAAAILGVWLPLALLAQFVQALLVGALLGHPASADAAAGAVSQLSTSARAWVALAMAGPHAVALVVAALAGGALVGRWGPARLGAREAALAGVLAALLASALAWTGTLWLPLVVTVLAGPAAYAGARVARRRMGRFDALN